MSELGGVTMGGEEGKVLKSERLLAGIPLGGPAGSEGCGFRYKIKIGSLGIEI